MTQRSLITGGAGFIGSHLAEHLHALGRQIVLVDDLSTGRHANIAPLMGAGCRFIRATVGDALADNPDLLEGVTHIYHLAAAVGVQRAVEDPLGTIRTNVHETELLLKHAAQSPLKPVVLFTSSSEVYGKAVKMPMREDQDLVLGPATSPRWSYALSKALDEQLAMAYHRQRGLATVIVRLFNIIGPRQIGRYGMVVPRFVQAAVRGEDLVVHGDGTQRRAFCDVRDAVTAIAALPRNPANHGQVFNLGSDGEVSIIELARQVIALAGGGTVSFVPYNQAYDQPMDDPARRVPDLTRLRAAVAFEPRYTLAQTLQELIAAARRADEKEVVAKPS